MPTAKRASMREGPLSQLFRKTARTPSPRARSPPAPAEAPQASADVPSSRRRAACAAAPVAATRRFPLRPAAEPGVGTGQPRQAGVPSPQQRLESAFAADIPASLMEPAAGSERRLSEAPAVAEDVYARPEHGFEQPPTRPPASAGR